MISLKVDVMGVAFDNVSMEEALDAAEDLLNSGSKGFCVTPNAEILYCALHAPEYQAVLNRAALVIPDGAGAVMGAKILGNPLKGKVPGIDFASKLCARMAKSGQKLFLLGSRPGVAEAAAENLTKTYPGLNICGFHHGFFDDPKPIIDLINKSCADVVFVCLGAPKQEFFMDSHLQELNARFMIGLGGSLDVYSGTLNRAPEWIRRCNMEWLYRLFQDPRRISRTVSRPKFVMECLKERRRRHKNG